MKCGKHQEKEKRSLCVHHVDYNKELTIKENCITLCLRCNNEVNFNRPHWIKFFQSILNKRYDYIYNEKMEVIINI